LLKKCGLKKFLRVSFNYTLKNPEWSDCNKTGGDGYVLQSKSIKIWVFQDKQLNYSAVYVTWPQVLEDILYDS